MAYAPKKVVWEITFSCNMNCIHCGSDCSSVEKPYQLSTSECFQVIRDLAQLGCQSIVLSGGEPLMRKDYGAIASEIKRHGMELNFISNGDLVNEDTVKVLRAIQPNAFGISLDAGEAYMHDYIRGRKGSFDKVINAFRLLGQNGIPATVVSTIHKLNYTQLPKIREALIKSGVRLWQIQYGDYIGRMTKETMITEGQFWEMAKFIKETREKYKKQFLVVNGADVFGYNGVLGEQIQGCWTGCFAGMQCLGLGSDGSVRGCLSLQKDEFLEPYTTKDRSLVEIWNDPESFKYNRQFDMSMLTGYCKECIYAAVCKAGCVRSASIEGGRCNPYCLYKIEKEGFSSEEQARTHFSKEELAEIYNPLKELPKEFYEKYEQK